MNSPLQQCVVFLVDFNENELDIIDRLDNIEEWDEVVEIANLIFDQDKETMEQQQSESEEEDPQGSFDFNIPMTGQQQAEWDDEDSIEDHKDQPEVQCNIQESEDSEEYDPEYQDTYEMNAGAGAEQQPSSITDEEYRMREEELVEEDAAAVLYGNIPDPNLKESIIGWKEVIKKSKEDFDKFTDESRNEDAVEALIAAIYFDGGLENVNKFVSKYIYPNITELSQDPG